MVHAPVPTAGFTAASVVDVPQTAWSEPASAAEGASLFDKVTSSVLVQAPLVIDQRSVTEVPRFKPVTVEFSCVGELIEAPFAGPTKVHCPVPTDGELAASLNAPLLQLVWSGPAADGVTPAGSKAIATSSKLVVQVPLLIDQRNV
jgi:hypothetical protein